ncbi:hypothetical protein WMY93_029099 [Mugilogobius chulae]|uniref:EF-hand domain-containing protein n=1 Tax=Mugilogobius chulae TaxID=88201 RepID=A0AAW0MTM1_9GOBI
MPPKKNSGNPTTARPSAAATSLALADQTAPASPPPETTAEVPTSEFLPSDFKADLLASLRGEMVGIFKTELATALATNTAEINPLPAPEIQSEHCRTWVSFAMGSHSSSLDDILEEDMHHWYTKFMRESPSGLITLFELKGMLDMVGMTEEASSYVDQVFFTFDMDGDGYIDFVEYIAAISLLLKGEINQKLKWYFKLFDQDGNGKIDKDEMETIFKAIQDITRSYEIPPEDIVNLIYARIDEHGEGELTLEEFISGAREHPDIMDMLTKMMDLTHVLEIILKGQRRKAVN